MLRHLESTTDRRFPAGAEAGTLGRGAPSGRKGAGPLAIGDRPVRTILHGSASGRGGRGWPAGEQPPEQHTTADLRHARRMHGGLLFFIRPSLSKNARLGLIVRVLARHFVAVHGAARPARHYSPATAWGRGQGRGVPRGTARR